MRLLLLLFPTTTAAWTRIGIRTTGIRTVTYTATTAPTSSLRTTGGSGIAMTHYIIIIIIIIIIIPRILLLRMYGRGCGTFYIVYGTIVPRWFLTVKFEHSVVIGIGIGIIASVSISSIQR